MHVDHMFSYVLSRNEHESGHDERRRSMSTQRSMVMLLYSAIRADDWIILEDISILFSLKTPSNDLIQDPCSHNFRRLVPFS